MTETMRVADLTVPELRALIRATVREVLQEQHAEPKLEPTERNPQLAILEIPPLSVGAWPEGLQLLSREEYYDDDAR